MRIDQGLVLMDLSGRDGAVGIKKIGVLAGKRNLPKIQ
jgi:hypothetical protein